MFRGQAYWINMIAVVQRVSQAEVVADEHGHRAEIGAGLCVLLAVEPSDTPDLAVWMARKLANLRVFSDSQGRMNRSVVDIGGQILLVSQFTLAGDCSKGNRPSFIGAADPDLAEPIYEQVGQLLRTNHRLEVETGLFGAMMEVSLVNDGPVTLILRTPAPENGCTPGLGDTK